MQDASMPAVRLGAASGLALCLEHGGVECLARRLASPDHELKCGKIALAAIKRGAEQGFALATGRINAAREHEGVAIHGETVGGPEIEMANPHLLIDEPDQHLDFCETALRHLELESAGKVQCFEVEHPGEGDLVIGPFARDQKRDRVV